MSKIATSFLSKYNTLFNSSIVSNCYVNNNVKNKNLINTNNNFKDCFSYATATNSKPLGNQINDQVNNQINNLGLIGTNSRSKIIVSKTNMTGKTKLLFSNDLQKDVESIKQTPVMICDLDQKELKYASEIAEEIDNDQIIISTTPGVELEELEETFGEDKKIVRVVPQSYFSLSHIGLVGNEQVTKPDINKVETLMKKITPVVIDLECESNVNRLCHL
eukprot:TRINITY_DN48038_c0_g1_i1.p1 TRINITY_DN48038_c0_g1~~TRINITY_DN48038_c0_g1_i1.p1  ORF type:complete len:238 (-),score=30.22 TRINITY_DN48038_c0_g1_i1:305-961(-)